MSELVDVPRGISRHVVRFVAYGEAIYALKELSGHLAEREYRLLAELDRLFIPVVEGAGIVTDRRAGGDRHGEASLDSGLDAILITRHLDFSLPYRRVLGATGGDAALSDRLLDSLVFGSLACSNNVPDAQFGDSTQPPNVVLGAIKGECKPLSIH